MILILGNANTGKSTIFQHLVGGEVRVLTLPGSEATISQAVHHRCGSRSGRDPFLARLRKLEPRRHDRCALLLDTPGTATLIPQTDEEAALREALLRTSPSLLLVVVDAKNVRRSLALTLHAAELGLPMVLAVNMSDEATARGIGVEAEHLGRLLGISVVSTSAVDREGLDELVAALDEPRTPRRGLSLPPPLEATRREIEALLEPSAASLPCDPRGMALLCLGEDPGVLSVLEPIIGEALARQISALVVRARVELRRPLEVVLTDLLYEEADQLAKQVVHQERRSPGLAAKLGALAEHRVWGLLIAAALVVAMYFWVGRLGATLVVDAVNTHLFAGLLTPLVEDLARHIPWAFLRDALVDPNFGLIPTGLFLAFGIVMPVLFFFFFAFGVLQSSGYLPRLSVLLDRSFRRIGLNGRGVMPLVMGFSCVTMALITTRMLESRRERLVASFLILGLPCAPLLAVMLLVLGEMPVSASVLVFGVLFAQKLVAGVVASRLLPGQLPDFIMVIPPLRLPRFGAVLVQSLRQTYAFMKEAVPLFLLASFTLFVFDRLGGLALIERLAHPMTQGLLQLPDQAVHVFIKSLIRRESGAAELAVVREHFSNLQLVVTLLVMSTIVPCVNAAIVLIKEQGLRTSAVIISAVMGYALAVGGLVSHLCTWLGVTFAG